jgi:hypothetical protein
MKTNLVRLSFLLLLLPLLLLTEGVAHAQSTAFTYNGRLNNNGAPVSGAYDVRFTLFDASVGGLPVVPAILVTPVDVINGLFSARLDFTANAFNGQPRWIHVEVRPNGGATYVALTPRQEVTSTPYAIRALTAGGLADGTVTANQLKIGGAAPQPGQLLSYSGGELIWTNPGAGSGDIWSLNGARAFYNLGNVGIGTASPSFKLDVRSSASTAIVGISSFSGGVGVFGESTSFNGVRGVANNVDHGAVVGVHNNGGAGVLGQSTGNGVFGNSLGTGSGVYGESAFFNGVRGVANNSTHGAVVGVHNNGGVGVLGQSTGTGVFGNSLGASAGVYGESAQFNGVRGVANNAAHGAVVGVHRTGGIGIYGTSSGTGVHGDSTTPGGFGGFFRNTAGGVALAVQGTARVGVLEITGGADLAEPFELSEDGIPKGAVVIIDDKKPGKLKLSTQAYDTRVAGIVSGANGVNPGITLRQANILGAGNEVSLSGRVYVLADAVNGAIRPGDLLTTSDTPGHAMKVTHHGRAQGAILGKAMSVLENGQGFVLVLVTLQ